MKTIQRYGQWNLPEYFCDTKPILQQTMTNFIGRESVVERCKNAISSSDSLIILEGDVGVGKTSIGNYVRYSLKNVLTPRDEYKAIADQTPTQFLLNLIQALVQEVYLSDSKFASFQSVGIFSELAELFRSGVLTNFSSKIVDIKQTRTAPIEITPTFLLDKLRELIKAVKARFGHSGRIVFQINNLDLNETFTHDQMKLFFNNMRDYFQLEGTAWIVTGAPGILEVVAAVKRVDQIVSVKEHILPLSEEEIVHALELRIKNAGKEFSQAQIPIEKELTKFICFTSEGVFRSVIGNLKMLLDNIPAKMIGDYIREYEVIEVFHRAESQKLTQLFNKYTNYREIFSAIATKPGITQDEIVASIKKKQSGISFELKKIQERHPGFLIVKKIGASNRYYLTTRIHFAVKGLTQNSPQP